MVVVVGVVRRGGVAYGGAARVLLDDGGRRRGAAREALAAVRPAGHRGRGGGGEVVQRGAGARGRREADAWGRAGGAVVPDEAGLAVAPQRRGGDGGEAGLAVVGLGGQPWGVVLIARLCLDDRHCRINTRDREEKRMI